MDITVFGGGYVGLVSAACFAEIGHRVCCVDTNAQRIASLEQGIMPFHEPKMPELLARHRQNGNMSFTASAQAGIEFGEVLMIAVGTPTAEDGAADLTQVFGVAEQIGAMVKRPKLVVVKSTVPAGTCAKVSRFIQDGITKRGAGVTVQVISSPEFLREGSAVDDCMRPDRIILGATDPAARDHLRELYAPLKLEPERFIEMSEASAELTKYAANLMLAARISLMNELANLAEPLGADIEAVRRGIGSDPRIGPAFLSAGCGYGGSCFPKDIRALLHLGRALAVPLPVAEAVAELNRNQPLRVIAKLRDHFGDNLSGRVVAMWGLAYKAGTDDIRESPARVILQALWEAGCTVQAHDRHAADSLKAAVGAREDLRLFDDPLKALEAADALVIATEDPAYGQADPAKIREHLKGDLLIDGRNLLDPKSVRGAGLVYSGFGRG